MITRVSQCLPKDIFPDEVVIKKFLSLHRTGSNSVWFMAIDTYHGLVKKIYFTFIAGNILIAR